MGWMNGELKWYKETEGNTTATAIATDGTVFWIDISVKEIWSHVHMTKQTPPEDYQSAF